MNPRNTVLVIWNSSKTSCFAGIPQIAQLTLPKLPKKCRFWSTSLVTKNDVKSAGPGPSYAHCFTASLKFRNYTNANIPEGADHSISAPSTTTRSMARYFPVRFGPCLLAYLILSGVVIVLAQPPYVRIFGKNIPTAPEGAERSSGARAVANQGRNSSSLKLCNSSLHAPPC
jgi:hypothetical protein